MRIFFQIIGIAIFSVIFIIVYDMIMANVFDKNSKDEEDILIGLTFANGFLAAYFLFSWINELLKIE